MFAAPSKQFVVTLLVAIYAMAATVLFDSPSGRSESELWPIKALELAQASAIPAAQGESK